MVRKRNIYAGQVPFPLPGSEGTEMRDNLPFRAKLTILRRCTNNQGAIAVDGEGRCFRIFRLEIKRLEAHLSLKLKIGTYVEGEWLMHRKGIAFGVIPVKLKNKYGSYVPFTERSRGSYKKRRSTVTGGVESEEKVSG